MAPLTIDFILGERKYVWFKVISKTEIPVVVIGATWQLLDGDEVVDSGDCIVEGNELKILLEPKQQGAYMLYIQYEVPPEVKKAGVSLLVH